MSAADEPVRRERPGKVAILRAAVRVMGEDGYEGASVRDMAARAGVTVAALYYHFPSKHELLREFLDESWSVVHARLLRRLAAADPAPAAQLDEVVGTLIASYLHDDFAQLASNVALREYTRLEPEARRAIDARRREVLDVVVRCIERGVADGAFTTATPHEAGRAVFLLCSAIVEPYPDMGRTMTEVIALYQGFARGIVGARSES